jgi:hypothetical protein
VIQLREACEVLFTPTTTRRTYRIAWNPSQLMIWTLKDEDEQAMHDIMGHFGMNDDPNLDRSSEQHDNDV